MTQINPTGLPLGLSPEQVQAILAYISQNPSVLSTPVPSSSSSTAHTSPSPPTVDAQIGSSVARGTNGNSMGGAGSIPVQASTRVNTPPPPLTPSSPPPTPRTPSSSKAGTSRSSVTATQTPSTKMAQLTLEGQRLSRTNTPRKGQAQSQKDSPKGPLPTGYDPALTYEDDKRRGDDQGPDVPATQPSTAAVDGDAESDPYEGFPEIVTVPSKSTSANDAMSVDAPPPASTRPKPKPVKRSSGRGKRNQPTTTRWINTRNTTSNSESSPPPVKRSPKKKARIASPPTASPSPAATTSSVQIEDANARSDSASVRGQTSQIEFLEELLRSARAGEENPSLDRYMRAAGVSQGASSRASHKRSASALIDDEAEEVSADNSDGNDDRDLDGFVVPDNVVEYDNDAPSLPDDEDVRLTRLHRRASPIEVDDDSDHGASDAHILPSGDVGDGPSDSQSSAEQQDGSSSRSRRPAKVDKGKGRADPVPATSSDRHMAQQSDPLPEDGLRDIKPAVVALRPPVVYPGSSPVDAGASICQPLDLSTSSSMFSWSGFQCDFLRSIGYPTDEQPLPGDCGYFLSDCRDDGWPNPSIEVISAAETHVHVPNLKLGLKLRRFGPFINEATVSPDDIAAVQVSSPSATQRYKLMVVDTRAISVSLTPGVIRYWRLDNPSTGSQPLRYVSMTPIDGLFNAMVALECLKFGQRELQCSSFNNAVRFATMPVFERPAPSASDGKSKMSSVIRRGNTNSSQTSRRSVNFEPSTNDTVLVLDARCTKLPEDISTWTSVLPRLEEPYPKDAVAFVAHTTSMWVGTRSKTAPSSTTYNVQHNLLFIVVIGVLPSGFV